MISLFASIYKDLHYPSRDLVGDTALDVGGYSDVVSFETDTLSTALEKFQNAEVFAAFCEKFINKSIYCYKCNSDGTVCRVDDAITQLGTT